MKLMLKVFHQSLPLAQIFRISRGAKSTAEVLVVVISDGEYFGWGEAVPYIRYKESIDSVGQQLWKLAGQDLSLEHHQSLLKSLPAGSARNAVDCAMWDLKCKRNQQNINSLIGVPVVKYCTTAQTLSIDSADNMHKAALTLNNAPLIKVKLDDQQILPRMHAIHAACPKSRFIIDPNEGWHIGILDKVVEPLKALNVVLLEQPLPANNDEDLRFFSSPIPLCADESCHTVEGIELLREKYQTINIKLDKTGGLSEAITLAHKARSLDFSIMLGCMVGSSLAMAPAYALASLADFIDLDGPLLVAKDRKAKFEFDNGRMRAPQANLWGTPCSSSMPVDLSLY